MRDELDKLALEARQPLDEFEAKEQARVDAIKLKLREITSYQHDSFEDSADTLKAKIEHLESYIVDSSFEEFENEACRK